MGYVYIEPLTHLTLEKMVAIYQKTFSKAFSGIESFVLFEFN